MSIRWYGLNGMLNIKKEKMCYLYFPENEFLKNIFLYFFPDIMAKVSIANPTLLAGFIFESYVISNTPQIINTIITNDNNMHSESLRLIPLIRPKAKKITTAKIKIQPTITIVFISTSLSEGSRNPPSLLA